MTKVILDSKLSDSSESLALDQAQMATFTEGLPIGLVLINEAGNLISINAPALEIFDLNRGDIKLEGEADQPTSFVSLLDENEQSFWQNLLLIVSASGEDYCNFRQYHQSRYDQKVLSLKINRMPNPTSGNHLAIAVWDVTSQVTKEKYIILSEKLVARGEMAASVADALQVHLDTLDQTAKLILANLETNKPEAVRFNSEALIDYIGTIRKYVALSLNYTTPETAFILYDFRDLIEDLLMTLKLKPRFQNIDFTINLAPDLPMIEMDVAQIQYVLKNLLNNAADSLIEKQARHDQAGTQFEKKITIETRWDLGREIASLLVSDNGEGIKPETICKIFNLHFSTKKVSRGLGLYRCQQIVDQHDARLIPESTPGEGSTFTLELPRLMKG